MGNSEKMFLKVPFCSDFECDSAGDVSVVSRTNVEQVSVEFILQNAKEIQGRLRHTSRILT